MKQQSQRTQLLLRLKEHWVSHSLVSYISLPRLPKQNTEAAWQDTQQGIVSHRSGSCKFQDQDGSQVGFSRVLFCLTGGPVLLCGTKIAGFFFPFSSFNNLFVGGGHMCPNTHLQLRGQFARVGSLPPLCGFQVSISDCQSWQQAAYLLSHPSSQPLPSRKDISLTWLGLYHCDGISQCDGVNYSQKNPSANTVTVEARAPSYELKVDDTA